MELLFDLFVELIGEILLQMFGEVLFELGFRSLAEVLNRKTRRNPVLAAIGYLLWGAIVGGLSLLVFRQSLIHGESFRLTNLIVTPIIAGIAMSALGAYRRKRGQELFRIDSFFYGYLFAVSMAAVRYFFTA